MIVYGYEEGRLFVKDARELEDRGLGPRIRLYRVLSDGLKMKALAEIPVRRLDYTGTVEEYASYEFGNGDYCAKLFSTKYGRNILEGRFDFGVAHVKEDEEDEDYF